MRVIATFVSSCGCVETKVWFHDYRGLADEYIVHYYVDGVLRLSCEYYAIDKDDALNVARQMANGNHPNAYL